MFPDALYGNYTVACCAVLAISKLNYFFCCP